MLQITNFKIICTDSTEAFSKLRFAGLNHQLSKLSFFLPPTLKKLEGHIAVCGGGVWCGVVCVYVCASVCVRASVCVCVLKKIS